MLYKHVNNFPLQDAFWGKTQKQNREARRLRYTAVCQSGQYSASEWSGLLQWYQSRGSQIDVQRGRWTLKGVGL